MSSRCEIERVKKEKRNPFDKNCINLKLETNRIRNNIIIILSINRRIFDIQIKDHLINSNYK